MKFQNGHIRYDVENGVTLYVECHRMTRKKI